MLIVSVLLACEKGDDPAPHMSDAETTADLVLRFVFDPDQPRLDNFGNPSEIPDGNAAQTPDFNTLSAHYVELIPNAMTWLGDGEVVYQGEETDAGGDTAIDFDQAPLTSNGETFLRIPLSTLAPGTYEYIRTSLSYQNFTVDYLASGFELTGTFAGFIGYNNYITSFTIQNETVEVNDDKLQGYWGFETVGQVFTGQAPAGATTVVNPLFDTSPIPAGSCLVTGAFEQPLQITGDETEDVVVTLSLSVNQSFEWTEVNEDGIWEPGAGEEVVDMGIRGMIALQGE